MDQLGFLPRAGAGPGGAADPSVAALRSTMIRRTVATLRGVLTALWPDLAAGGQPPLQVGERGTVWGKLAPGRHEVVVAGCGRLVGVRSGWVVGSPRGGGHAATGRWLSAVLGCAGSGVTAWPNFTSSNGDAIQC